VFNGRLKSLRKVLVAGVALAALALVGASSAVPLDDPTRPPTAQSAKVHKAARKPLRWTLSSTLVSAQRRTAVINGRVVGVGEKINGARVVAILPSKVHLRRKGRDITLVLLKQDVKRPSRHGSGKP